MRSEYDFSKSRKNPYANSAQAPRSPFALDTAAVDYFKEMAAELGMPYKISSICFLRDCAIEKRRPSNSMAPGSAADGQ